MSIIRAIESRSDTNIISLQNPTGWVADWLGGMDTKSGAKVNEKSSLGVSAVWSCVKLLARIQASLPIKVYRKLSPTGKELASTHPIYRLLHDQPNDEQTAFNFKMLLSLHQNLWGAGVCEIEFDRNGFPRALWPIPPWRVKPDRTKSGVRIYEVDLQNGKKKTLFNEQVCVFPHFSLESGTWLSPIAIHRETIGLSMAMKEYGAKTFGSGINPAGIVTHPGTLSESSEAVFKENMQSYSGLGSLHRVMLLEEGMKFEKVGIPPSDAQYLEAQKFTLAEIARIYNVPLIMLQEQEKSTTWGSGLEEINSGFVTYTLMPDLVMWSQEFKSKLLRGEDEYFVEFVIEALMRGKLLDRYRSYMIGRQGGWLNANMILDKENENPIGPQGDVFWAPQNMIDAEKFMQDLDKEVEQEGKDDA